MKNSNYLNHIGTNAAYKQFLNDLKSDKDFIEFKKRTWTTTHSYGVVIVRGNKFVIEKLKFEIS